VVHGYCWPIASTIRIARIEQKKPGGLGRASRRMELAFGYDAKIIVVDFQTAAHLRGFVDGLQHLPRLLCCGTVAGRVGADISKRP
jgi:hypothetical protein